VYATELVQVCFQRKAPTIVLKLDFAKAFDTVNWESLLSILRARGFNSKWCQWISQVLSTSLTAVLINVCPGPWFSCHKGLRQGELMSLYLFLLVADVLQMLIKHDGRVRHPLVDASCPVLQYADDTLLLLRGELSDVCRLKVLLEQSANATSLKINFDKSTTVPMHMPEDALPACVQALGCRQEGFPQTYLLGLPLSSSKLNLCGLCLRPLHQQDGSLPGQLAGLSSESHGAHGADQRRARWPAVLPDGHHPSPRWSDRAVRQEAPRLPLDGQ
jgi:hypothetical protein